MKKLLFIFILVSSNFLLLGSKPDIEYTKNTCYRTYSGRYLSTDKERERCDECIFSREEVYNKDSKRYIASIAYNPLILLTATLHI